MLLSVFLRFSFLGGVPATDYDYPVATAPHPYDERHCMESLCGGKEFSVIE